MNTQLPSNVTNNTSIDINANKKKERNEGILTCFMLCGFTILIISFVAAYGVYFSFSIYALSKVSDNTVRDICDGSIMWRYVLCSIIVPFALGGSKNSNSDKENGMANIFALAFCWFTASIIMTIFGGIEVFETDCKKEFLDNKNTELLYNIGVIGFGLYFAISILLFIIMFVCSCFVCCKCGDKLINQVKTNSSANKNQHDDTESV